MSVEDTRSASLRSEEQRQLALAANAAAEAECAARAEAAAQRAAAQQVLRAIFGHIISAQRERRRCEMQRVASELALAQAEDRAAHLRREQQQRQADLRREGIA